MTAAPGRFAAGAVLVAALAGCAAAGSDAAVAAVRVDASAAGSDELADAAARLAGASSVLLAADAFAEQAELTVEPRPGRTLQGPLDGRSRQVPVRLRLQRDGDGCRLLRVSDGETVRLRKVRCRALSAG